MPVRRRDPGARIVKRGCSLESVINDKHIFKPETQHAHKMHESTGLAFCSESEPDACTWTATIHLSEATSGVEPNPVGSKKSNMARLSPAMRKRSRKASSLKVVLFEKIHNLRRLYLFVEE